MAAPARYPDPASPYFIEARDGLYDVHHEHFGRLLTCDCLGEARDQISDLEDEDAARAEREARQLAEDEAATELFDAVMAGREAA